MKKILISTGMLYAEDDKWNTLVPIAYSEAIKRAGGVPVIVPNIADDDLIDSYVEMCEGFLFTGGVDVNPMIYNEEMILETKKYSFERDEFELKLLEKIRDINKPILGICRGMQLINSVYGGSLYQDLKIAGFNLNHNNPQNIIDGTHSIAIEKDSILFDIFGEKAIVNSYHHQAVKDVAEGFRVTSRAKDGIVESMEWTGERYIHLVQFHPEMMIYKHEKFEKIFEDFVKRA